MENILYLVFAAALISFATTPIVKVIAKKTGAIDIPKMERKIHSAPTPLLGGLAIFAGIIIAMCLKESGLSKSEIGILIGAAIILAGGVLDDIYDLKPILKLAFQISAVIALMLFNVDIQIITNPLSVNNSYFNVGILSIPITFIWVIGVTNAINLIDGLDGLAAGIALISAFTMFIIALLNNRYDAMVLSAILCGAVSGFIPYNFNPASIFMGDTGSQLLGFLLAGISIEGAIKSATAFAVVAPIIALGVPIYDTLFAIIRRKLNGKPIMSGDRGHLHHRLMEAGLSQRQTVVVMYITSAILGGISIIAMQISNVSAYFLLAIIMAFTIFVARKYSFFKQKN